MFAMDYETHCMSWVERIKSGDCTAENELLEAFQGRIQLVLGRKVYAVEDRQDLFSEIQWAIVDKLRQGKFVSEKGTLAGYIYGITINKINDYLRKKNQKKNMPLERIQEMSAKDSRFSALETKELEKIMSRAIKTLDKKYKKVLYLKYFEELPVRAIAERLDIEPKVVSARLNYAYKLLDKYYHKKKNFSIIRDFLLICW